MSDTKVAPLYVLSLAGFYTISDRPATQNEYIVGLA